MERFIEQQKICYGQALYELKMGKKMSHWMWYIFPQIQGLGYSNFTRFYEIKSIEEANEYLCNNYLRNNLFNITKVLLNHANYKNILDIMDPLDAQKLFSCMTLFNAVDKKQLCRGIFKEVLIKFFNGKQDKNTLDILEKMENNYSGRDYMSYIEKTNSKNALFENNKQNENRFNNKIPNSTNNIEDFTNKNKFFDFNRQDYRLDNELGHQDKNNQKNCINVNMSNFHQYFNHNHQ